MNPDMPSWLSAAVDQRLALMNQFAPAKGFEGFELAITPLTEPRPGATKRELDRWERSCDNCGVFCPPHGTPVFFTGHVDREVLGTRVTITFGACADCAGLL